MTDKHEFKLVVSSSNEDFKLVIKPFCQKCAKNKLSLLTSFDLSRDEAREMCKLGLNIYKIKCECSV